MIMHRSDQTQAIRALRSAAPYIRLYKGKTFVVKAGGGVFGDAANTRALVAAASPNTAPPAFTTKVLPLYRRM